MKLFIQCVEKINKQEYCAYALTKLEFHYELTE